MALTRRSGVEPIDPSLVPLIVSEANLSQYFQVAICTVLLYDTVISMDKEVKYFWVQCTPSALQIDNDNLQRESLRMGQGVPRRSVNFVYFTIRYIAVFAAFFYLNWNALDVDLILCGLHIFLRVIFPILTRSIGRFSAWIFNMSNILMIRVLALYSQQRILSVLLSSLLALEAAFKLTVVIYLTIIEHVTVGDLGEYGATCEFDAALPKLWGTIDWVIPLVYALILLFLALYKAAEFWKAAAGFKNFTLVNVLIQDQGIYFLFVVLCSVFNILVYNINTPDNFAAQVLVVLGSPLFLSVLGSRMLVNLKEAGERGRNAGTSYKLETLSNVEFA